MAAVQHLIIPRTIVWGCGKVADILVCPFALHHEGIRSWLFGK